MHTWVRSACGGGDSPMLAGGESPMRGRRERRGRRSCRGPRPAPASAPAGCFCHEAMGEVTCSEVVGKASGPYWLLRPPAPARWPPAAARRPPPTGPALVRATLAGCFRRRPPPPGRKT